MTNSALLDIYAAGHSASSPPVPETPHVVPVIDLDALHGHAVPEGCSAIFAPCLDPHCQRPCGANNEEAMKLIDERNAEFRRIYRSVSAESHITARHRYFIAMALTTIIGLALIAGMAAWSMPRVERATQEDMK